MIELASQNSVSEITFAQVQPLEGKPNEELRLEFDGMKEFYFTIAPKLRNRCKEMGINLHITPEPIKPIYYKNLSNSQFWNYMKNFSKGKYGANFFKDNYCLYPWNYAYISSEGEVYPCPKIGVYSKSKSIGNIKKKSIIKMWDSKKLRDYTRKSGKHSYCLMCNNFSKRDYTHNLFLKNPNIFNRAEFENLVKHVPI